MDRYSHKLRVALSIFHNAVSEIYRHSNRFTSTSESDFLSSNKRMVAVTVRGNIVIAKCNRGI